MVDRKLLIIDQNLQILHIITQNDGVYKMVGLKLLLGKINR